ncbi:MAG: ABC transporter substrate-binding protein [Syntrophorhabdales bacterium]|jgi:iron complex transport system substrate-binding protein
MVQHAYGKILRGGAAAVLVAALLVLSGGQAGTASPPSVTYRDKLGRTVTVPVPVKRAVFLISYELIPVLGVWDRVVGVGRWVYDNDLIRQVKPDIRATIPSVGSGTDVNVEALMKLAPDVVVTWTFKPELVRFMEERGLRVIAIYPESLAELYDVMRLHGRLFQREARMERAIGEMEGLFRMIGERVGRIPEGRRKKVLYIGTKPTSVSGGIGITNEMIALIGAHNPASTLQQRNVEVPLERIIAWNPDVIVIWGNARYGVSDLTGDPQWRLLEAVRKERVYKAPEWSTWSPRLAPFALWMAAMTYPEYFKDVDMDNVVDEFHRKVFGVSGKGWH